MDSEVSQALTVGMQGVKVPPHVMDEATPPNYG